MGAEDLAREVVSLACARDAAMACRCLGSLRRHSVEPLRFTIHDDGSLTSEAEASLLAALTNCKIISRAESNQRMEALLSRHPHCAAFRRTNILALKLLDAMLLSDGEVLHFCDTDVLFFRPVANLFDLPADVDAVFMHDYLNSYAMRSFDLFRYRCRLIGCLNSGLISFRRTQFDLDRLESFFAIPPRPILSHFYEQTAWAMLAARCRTQFWNPNQIRLILPNENMLPRLIAGHYVSTHRRLISDANEFQHEGDAPETPALVHIRTCSPADMLKYELSRLVNRKLPRVGSALLPLPRGYDRLDTYPAIQR